MADAGIPAPQRLRLLEDAATQSHQWEEWAAELVMYFDAANITAAKRKRALLLYLGGEQIRHIYETYVDTENTYDSALTILNTHFERTVNLSYERYKFHSEKIFPNENVLAYITRLRKLVKSCKFDEYSPEDALVDHYISTCGNNALRRKLLREEKLTLDNLIKIVSTSELVESQVKVMDKGNTENTREEINRMNKTTCYGCGSSSHYKNSKDCPARDTDCFNCGVKGHYGKYCFKKPTKERIHCAQETEESEVPLTLDSLSIENEEDYLF